MPAAGAGMESGTIVRWLKAKGSAVQRGEPLAEIETDKTTMEIEARTTGVLSDILFDAGADVGVGVTIGYIETDAE